MSSLPSTTYAVRYRASTSRTRSSPISSSWANRWSRTAVRTVLPRLTRPLVGATVPATSPRRVDFPAPLAPRIAVRSPGAIRHVTSCRTSPPP